MWFKVSLGEENVEKPSEHHSPFISSRYCLMRFKVSLGEENVEKQKENHKFFKGSGYCLMRFKVSLGEEMSKNHWKTIGFLQVQDIVS